MINKYSQVFLILGSLFSFNSFANAEIVLSGKQIYLIDIAYDHYKEENKQTKYEFFLNRENFSFHLIENEETIFVKIEFNALEFKENTGRIIFGGSAEVLLDKKSRSVTDFKMIK